MHYPRHLMALIDQLRKLPGVGSRTAERYVFEILRWDSAEQQAFGQAIAQTPQALHNCSECGALIDPGACTLCTVERASTQVMGVVATYRDLCSIEQTGEFLGLYHVLGGLLSPLRGIGPQQLRCEGLCRRIEEHGIRELILAFDATLEGDATALYLRERLQSIPNLKISRLAFGIPMGSSLDYIDGSTLARALSGRHDF